MPGSTSGGRAVSSPSEVTAKLTLDHVQVEARDRLEARQTAAQLADRQAHSSASLGLELLWKRPQGDQ
jgi:hypothetical protein